jgi:hypothetical protein
MKAAAFSLALALPSLVVACVHATDVRGPDGETAHLVSCTSTEDCYGKAGELCPEGYLIRSNDSKAIWSPGTGGGPVLSETEVLVSCKADVTPLPPARAASAPDAREDTKVCEAAYKYEEDLAAYWITRTPGAKRLAELPESHDFVAVCREMPERVQRCLHEHYRQAHDKACEAVLSRLDPQARGEIDSLFLEAVTAAPARMVPATATSATPAATPAPVATAMPARGAP